MLKKKTDYSSKITEIKNKISSISGLTTNSLLQLKKKTNVGNLVKKTPQKTDFNTKISETEGKVNNHNHDKHITTPEFDNLTAKVFHA